MNSVKEMLKDKKFWFFTLITVLFFGTLIKMEYATDTYVVFENSSISMVKHFLSSGRFITAIAYITTKVLHLGKNATYLLSYFTAIICTSIAVYKLEKIFNKDIKFGIISSITSILIIINLFSIELYLFIEKGILMMSVLFSVLAFEHMVKHFEGNKKSIILVIIYMFLANFAYQGTVGLFVAISLLYIVKHTKDYKSFVMNTIKTALCYGIPALVNYIIVRFVFANARISGSNNIVLSIKKVIISTQDMIISTYNIIPKYLFIVVFIALLFFIVYSIINDKSSKKYKLWLLFGIIFVVIGNLVVTVFPQLLQATESIWFVPRSTYTFASLIGILVVYLFMNTTIKANFKKVLVIMLIGYMIIQYIGFQNIIRDRYITNYMDSYEIMQIRQKIDFYEKETGNTITKISFYYGDERKYSYPNLYVDHDTNIRAEYPDWSRLNSINYFLSRNLEEVEKSNEIYENYFKDKKWNFYSDEQIILVEDTIHLYIY